MGYEAATMRSIARRARVDPRLVRYYFPSKKDLMAEALPGLGLGTQLADAGRPLAAALQEVWREHPVDRRAVVAGGVSSEPAVQRAFIAAASAIAVARRSPEDPSGLTALLAFSHLLGSWMLTRLGGRPHPQPRT